MLKKVFALAALTLTLSMAAAKIVVSDGPIPDCLPPYCDGL